MFKHIGFKESLYLIISLGAVLGALVRWQVNHSLAVNMAGTFILGFLVALPFSNRRNLFLGVGFSGSLTTFSSWIYDSFYLINEHSLYSGFELILKMIVFTSLAAGLGFRIGRTLVR